MMKEVDYKQIIDKATFGFFRCMITINDNGGFTGFKFLETNPAFMEMTTFRREDIFDENDLENSSDLTLFKKQFSENCYRALMHGEIDTEFFCIPLNRWFKMQVLVSEKDIFSAILFDITQEKEAYYSQLRSKEQLEQSRAELKAIYESSPVMMCVVDENRRLQYANQAFTSFTGSTEEELKNGKVCGVFGCINALDDPRGCGFSENCKSCSLLAAIEDTLKTGRTHTGIIYHSTVVNHDDPMELYLNGSTAIIRSENHKKLLLICLHDITSQKQNENDIIHKNNELKQINASKDKFFSIISHDLKSPFNSIVGFSEILIEKVTEKDSTGIERYAEIIQKSANRAINLLVNLTEWSLSQTNRKTVNAVHFDFNELTEEIISIFSEIANQKSIKIEKDIPVNISWKADRDMISTVLRNLVSNALKFSFSGSSITIAAEIKNNELIVAIRDKGVGINHESIGKLFLMRENYTTLGTQKEVGTGLGLILCKEFVEKQGGTIWVESEPGKGSVFSFSLPLIS